MRIRTPAVLGGQPAFPDGLPLVRPTIPDIPALTARLEQILQSGILTNGPTVRELEGAVADRIGAPHVVAVSNCTAGLMLTYQALGVTGPVVMPSMTFSASAHAVHWAGATPVWAEVDPERCTLDPADAARLVDGAAAISATHVYGAPAQVEALQELADSHSLPLVYDAAHGLGALHDGVPIGNFGTAEVFSMSPTKVVVAGEGGLVVTKDANLAESVRIGRDYGNPGDYNCRFPGLNARMSELHAAVALNSIHGLDERIAYRNHLVTLFKKTLQDMPGISFQLVDRHDVSSYKDLTLIIDGEYFGLNSRQTQTALKAEGIDSRRYFYPPIHRQDAYRSVTPSRELPVTDLLSSRVLTPPLYSHMSEGDVERVADSLIQLHDHASELQGVLL